jgi:hypothetical protein
MRSIVLGSLSVAMAVLALSPMARAQSTIRQPNQHPHYTLELEPHLAVGFFDPPGLGTGDGFGPGLRASFPLSEDGFLTKLNDTVALGVGLDWIFYDADGPPRAGCDRFVTAPNDTRVCVELGEESTDQDYFYVPVVMQWNFWLHRRFSAFGEPGLALHLRRDGEDDSDLGANLVLGVGGRWHFVDNVAVTARLGYPTSTIGFSFLL